MEQEFLRYANSKKTIAWKEAVEQFGIDALKKARQKGMVKMIPNPHTDRNHRRVGQKISRLLPGWAKKGKTEQTVHTIRYGANVIPQVVVWVRGKE